MNVISRGARNALRSPVRSGAIVLMLGISIALVLVMLAARSSVTAKIAELKQTTATGITVSAAGIRGGEGGGTPLTGDQVTKVTKLAHVSSVTSTLTDQLASTDTNLTASFDLGSFGQRMQRFESSGSSENMPMPPADTGSSSDTSTRQMPTPRTRVTGTTNPNSASTSGGSLTISSGTTIDGNSSDLVALVGTNLATKNNLKAGSTFTAYGKTITVKGIYTTGNAFEDNGIIMPLATLQTLTDQAGAVVEATVAVDSADNVTSVVSAIKSTLGSSADVTSEADRAAASVEPLQSISSLTFVGVIGAAGAGAVIILLAMIMIVRERRREIGVIKAIGGTNAKVIVQFMAESITLTIIGAIVGIAFGIITSGPLTSALVSSSTSSSQQAGPGGMRGGGFGRQAFRAAGTNVKQITGDLSPRVFAGALGVTFLIAIIGSVIPAWLIARVRPAEVLRTE